MRNRGFTLVEVILVMGILVTVASFTVPLYRTYQIRNDLNIAAEQIAQALTRAQLLSQSMQHDAKWGFHVASSTLYQGNTYATRNQGFDEQYPMSSSIATSGISEVSFSKMTGRPNATGSIVLTSLTGEQRTIDILLNSQGITTTAASTTGRLYVCHQTGGTCKTLSLPYHAWPAHHKHGDYLGQCYDDDGDGNVCDHQG
jgi:prepilin-type N-terminal cleavage/methylation domain-containing protein